MTIHFSIEYRTVWGEALVLKVGKHRFDMQYAGDGMWETTLSGRAIRSGQRYAYEVIRDGRRSGQSGAATPCGFRKGSGRRR